MASLSAMVMASSRFSSTLVRAWKAISKNSTFSESVGLLCLKYSIRAYLLIGMGA